MYLTRNQAYVQAYRGFESHPLRQMHADFPRDRKPAQAGFSFFAIGIFSMAMQPFPMFSI